MCIKPWGMALCAPGDWLVEMCYWRAGEGNVATLRSWTQGKLHVKQKEILGKYLMLGNVCIMDTISLPFNLLFLDPWLSVLAMESSAGSAEGCLGRGSVKLWIPVALEFKALSVPFCSSCPEHYGGIYLFSFE